jgi:hypothetical protein
MFYTLWHLTLTAALIAPVWLFARRVAATLLPRADAPTRLLVGLLAAFGLAVATGGLLGWIGRLTYRGYLLLFWFAAAGAWIAGWRQRSPAADEDWPRPPAWLLLMAVVAATLAAGALGAGLAQPVGEYDALTYHLHFPVQWLNARRIFLIDTPFGDAAPAYAPGYGELWFAWLLAPWRGGGFQPLNFKLAGVDALAKVGQFPFFAMALAALLSLARRLAGSKWTSYLPALVFAFTPWAVTQAVSPAVDLLMAALFLTSLAFALHYRDEGDRTALALAGAALGLALGVKFVALAYAPLVAAPPLVFLIRRRAARDLRWWLGPLAGCAAPWPLRNLILTGNPVFPLNVSGFGLTIFPGAYDRAAMLQSPFHAPDLAAALAVSGQAIGFWLTPLAAAGVVLGLVAAWRQPAWRAVAWLAPVGLIWHFLVVPYSSQDRFLLWIVALAFLPLAAWPERSRWSPALFGSAALLLALDLCGAGRAFRLGDLPIAAQGLFAPRGWLAALPVAALIGGVHAEGGRRRWTPVRRWLAAFAAGAVAAAALAQPGRGVFVATGGGALRELPLAGYAEIWQRQPATTAYAGRNRPYYLAGRTGLGRVLYVNIDGRRDFRLHDYVREWRAHGWLNINNEKDAWRSRAPDYAAWRAALAAAKVQFLFVERLSPFDRSTAPHDADGFPLERVWAQENRDQFFMMRAGDDFELFGVRRFAEPD